MSFVTQKRSLSQAEPHEPQPLGPSPLIPLDAESRVEGVYRILGARKELTISLFDLRFATGGAARMSSEPCVALNVLFEASGCGWLLEGEQRTGALPFQPGFYCMIAPEGAAGIDEIRPGTRFRGLDVRMTPEFWRKCGGPGVEALNASPNQAIRTRGVWAGLLPMSAALAQRARSLYDGGSNGGADLAVEACSLDLIGEALRLLAPDPAAQTRPLGRDQRAVGRILALMEQDLARPWTVAELAAASGIGVKRLKLVFPQETGLPVYRYLQERRLQEAERLLREEKASVTQAALAVGYSSLSRFAALFRRRFGAPPSRLIKARAFSSEAGEASRRENATT